MSVSRQSGRGIGALALLLLLTARSSLAQEPATITGSESGTHKILRGFNERVILTSVDHHVVGTNLLLALNVTKTLTPGRHTLGVRYTQGTWVSHAHLWLDAEPGKAYVVRGFSASHGVNFRIEEADTGRVVGGIDAGEDSKDDVGPSPAPATASTP
jgi:hypothetical protein